MTDKKCDHCGRAAQLTEKPDHLAWSCTACGSSVRCAPGTTEALGKMAPAEVRKIRRELHLLIDPLWQNGLMNRDHVYTILRSILNLDVDNGHISMLSPEQLEFAMSWFAAYIETNQKYLERRKEKRDGKLAKRRARLEDQDEY